jgi:molecular chaperone GrpE
MADSVRDDEDFEGEIATEADARGANEELEEGGAATSELDEAKRELEALNDKHLRLAAEFSNYRRRTEQERLSAWERAQSDLISKFLDVLDDLQRVAQLDLENTTVENILEGIDLVERKFSRLLEDAGVETIDPLGLPFDPQNMEAITRMPAETPDQEETVAQVMQKGYALKGMLMRPARVAVYKHG